MNRKVCWIQTPTLPRCLACTIVIFLHIFYRVKGKNAESICIMVLIVLCRCGTQIYPVISFPFNRQILHGTLFDLDHRPRFLTFSTGFRLLLTHFGKSVFILKNLRFNLLASEDYVLNSSSFNSWIYAKML